MKLINVIDENGKSYSSTYVKRAKGLVKHDRAYWVDDSTICLRVPLSKTEVKILKANDFERMIALTVAGNYAIRNRNKEECYMAFTTIKTLCDTYDGIISELEKANIEIYPGLEKICFDKVENNHNANVLRDLEQLVYTKNCLLNPILKLEKSNAEKSSSNSQSKEIFSNSKIKITVEPNDKTKVESTDDLKKENSKLRESKLEELKELEEELEELEDELEEIDEDLQCYNQELDNAKKELVELLEEVKELELDINDLKLDINNEDDDEELEELKEELEDKESDLQEVLEDIDSTKEEISELEKNIKENEKDKEEVEFQIKSLKTEINNYR